MTTDEPIPTTELTPELWTELVSTPSGVKARAKALHESILLLGDIIDTIEERAPKGASDDEKRVLRGVRMIAHASASLIDGVTQLLPDNPYAAAALVRQMVEVEYLAWTCDHDSEELLDWLTSDRERRRKRWQPQHMRNRAGGVFNDEDYRAHCELGGHPTPPGIIALHGLSSRIRTPGGVSHAQSYEALLHTSGTVGHLARAAAARHPKLGAAPIRAHMIREEWMASDRAARWPAD